MNQKLVFSIMVHSVPAKKGVKDEENETIVAHQNTRTCRHLGPGVTRCFVSRMTTYMESIVVSISERLV